MLEYRKRPFDQKLVELWQARDLVPAGTLDTLPWLIDLGLSRHAFLLAVADHTPAWAELVSACRELAASDMDVHSNEQENEEGPWLTPQQTLVGKLWLRAHHLDVPWMQEWTWRAMYLLRFLIRHFGSEVITIDSVLHAEEGGFPVPDPYDVADASRAFEWKDSEPPPSPHLESLEVFLDRMRESFRSREQALKDDGLTARRSTAKHAEWFARFQVGKERVAHIIKRADVTRQAFDEAVPRFSERIALPMRRSGTVSVSN